VRANLEIDQQLGHGGLLMRTKFQFSAVVAIVFVSLVGASEASAAGRRISLRAEASVAGAPYATLRVGRETRRILESSGREMLAVQPAEVADGGVLFSYAPVPERLKSKDFVAEALVWSGSGADAPIAGGGSRGWKRIGLVRHRAGAGDTISTTTVYSFAPNETVITAFAVRITEPQTPQLVTTAGVEIPRGARLDVAYVVDEADPSPMTSVVLTVTAIVADGDGKLERTELFRRDISEPAEAVRWTDVSLDVGKFAGDEVSFEFRSESRVKDGALDPHVVWAVPTLAVDTRGVPPVSVLLVSLDSLGASAMSCCGATESTTPFLDSFFGRDGAVLRRAVTDSEGRLAAHASLLTGASPCRHESRSPSRAIDSSVATLAERFSEVGYDTAGWTNTNWLAAELGFARGFERYLEADRSDPTANVFASALEWIGSRGTHPFFAFVHAETPKGVDSAGAYRDYARRVDAALKQFLLSVDRTVDPDRLVIVITSARGIAFEGDGTRDDLRPFAEDRIRVPMLIRGGGVKAGIAPRAVFATIDVAPTLLTLAAISAPAEIEGVDRAEDLRRGAAWSAELRFVEGARTTDKRESRTATQSLPQRYAAIEGPLKLISVGTPASYSAYDVLLDPAERVDLAKGEAPPEWIARLRGVLDAHVIACEVSPQVYAGPAILPPASRIALAELGYLD
jgi:arylsulfatase A-like enzyme